MADLVRRMDEGNRKMKEKLAALEPEKRQALEREMATSGVDLRIDKPDGVMSIKLCITAKDVAKLAVWQEESKANCKRTVTHEADDVVIVKLQCVEKSKQLTTGTQTFYGDKAYTATFPMATANGRWLSDDCGNLAN